MNMKFTIDTIKDLKIKVKEMNGTLLSYYTKDEFKPDDSFRLFTEQSEASRTDGNLVNQMISAFEQNVDVEDINYLLAKRMRKPRKT